MKRAAIAALLLLLGAGCRTLSPVPPGVALSLDDPRVRSLLGHFAQRVETRASLRGRARLAVDSADGEIRVRGKQVLVARRPAQLRVEVMGFLNQSVAVVVTDGASFEVFNAQDQSYRSGEVGPALLWDEARIALTPHEAIEVLLGVPAPEPDWRPASAVQAADGELRIDFADDSGAVRHSLAFDPDGSLRRAVRFDPWAGTVWQARFGDYREIAGFVFAHSIELDVRAGDTHAEISLSDIELNPALRDDIFRLERPSAPVGVQSGDADGEGG